VSVLVVGSINVDLVVHADRLPAPGETVLGGRFARGGGGKSANAAVAAARLGAGVVLVGAVGDDDLGEEALAELEAEGIDVGGVARLDGVATGVALIVVEPDGENQIAVASGANGALDPGWVREAVAGAQDAQVALLGFEVPDAVVAAGAEAAAHAGLRVVADPAPARALPPALLAAHPLLTPNASEARALSGEQEPERAARALAARTGAPVLVTLGARGALLLRAPDAEAEPIASPEVRAVDATGAGDTLAGALAAELAAGAELREAAARAVAAASEATTVAGARTGMPRRTAR